MLIYTGDLRLLTEDGQVANVIDRVVDVAESLGGHIVERTDTGVTVKVPSARFREAFGTIEPLGVVTRRSVKTQDVTEEFQDAEVRLLNLRATRQRLQEFLARAANIQDALTVERELERVAKEIDVLEGHVHFLRERAAFSQITCAVEAKPAPALLKEPPPPQPGRKKILDLPVAWLSELGVERLLSLR